MPERRGAPDAGGDLARLVELEDRLAVELTAAREEARGRVEAARAEARRLEGVAEAELAAAERALAERLAAELAAARAGVATACGAAVERLDAFSPERVEALARRVVERTIAGGGA
ncbi:MAG TPA: hypothetical protein VFQ38_24325 [Longimicrobiales bacterium]|nr:hypothetical protein [Longimicrobiales bacterium]